MFKFMAARIVLQLWKQMTITQCQSALIYSIYPHVGWEWCPNSSSAKWRAIVLSHTTLYMLCIGTSLKIEDYGGESSCFQINGIIAASIACCHVNLFSEQLSYIAWQCITIVSVSCCNSRHTAAAATSYKTCHSCRQTCGGRNHNDSYCQLAYAGASSWWHQPRSHWWQTCVTGQQSSIHTHTRNSWPGDHLS